MPHKDKFPGYDQASNERAARERLARAERDTRMAAASKKRGADEIKRLHQGRIEKALSFVIGEVVTDGKRQGKVLEINKVTGELLIMFRKQERCMPDFIEKSQS